MPVKQHIAIVIPGGIGTGKQNIGVPVLENIVSLLAKDFSITVFQLHRTNENYKTDLFTLIDIQSGSRILKSLKFFFWFWKFHKQNKFIAVHGFWVLPSGFLAVAVGKLFKIRSIISLQGGDAIALTQIKYGQLQKWFPRKIVLWSLGQVDSLVSPTRYLVDNLKSHGLTRRDVKFIPLGIDTHNFRFQKKQIQLPVNFLHIGNFNLVKDQETLLRAFAIISKKIPSKLTIIGEGEREHVLKTLVKQLDLEDSVTFHPQVTYNTLPAFYERANILLHTSLSEGHPIVVEEAMSCGVLICGTQVGLLYDLPECCVSVSVGDFSSLATATIKLIGDDQLKERMQLAAYEWATKHSLNWTAEEFKKLYSSRI